MTPPPNGPRTARGQRTATAIVTGAARGNGAAVALRPAHDGPSVGRRIIGVPGLSDVGDAARGDMTRSPARRLGRVPDVAPSVRMPGPVGRVGGAEDIAYAPSFLVGVSPGSGFGCGRILYVAGGPVD
ncbi:hypothetical protein P3L51_00015 [Streptomyces sp. PSRA5]|uniref:hypothetical protein n=1 Tax=Streptomyces panacea TaxID=3035064 RepID=UPI00339CB14C